MIKHFTCKFTLSNGNKKLGDLDQPSLEKIGDIFARHAYSTTIRDQKEYDDQAAHTNHLLEQLSNNTHIAAINLDREFNGSVVNATDNSTIIIQDLVGHYNESACFDNIIL